MRRATRLVAVMAMVCLAACGNTDDPAPEPTPEAATEAAMNIDEGQAHYRDVIEKIKATGRCAGKPLAWEELEPESVEGADSDETGAYTAYVYRGPFLGSDLPCRGEDFTAIVKQITAVLEDNGGVADDVVLDDDSDHAGGGEVKWRDNAGATFTFSSGVRSSFSMVSDPLPKG